VGGPRALPATVEFRVPDPGRSLGSVVLGQEVARPRPGPPFAWEDGAWRLRFPRPPVDRLEYLLGIDGAFAPDLANPHRAAGPFGDKSVVEWPEYTPPPWLDAPADAGPVEWIELRSRRLVARVPVLLYRTPERPPESAPLLVVHDGPEYAEFAALIRLLDAAHGAARLPALTAALIPPVDRNETYSASALYAGALARELLPELARRVPHGARIGMGASLGALAMLHVHRRHPKTFDGLFLQSGSYFRQRWDKVESSFPRYQRITRFVGTVLRADSAVRPIPVSLTCGTAEENVENNRAVVSALAAQGYDARLVEVRDAHNWTCWRDGFDPALPELIQRLA
jgi:enterochelin esterase-like enzyme